MVSLTRATGVGWKGAYDDEGPGDVDVFDMEMVAEEDKDAGDDEGREQLAGPEEMEDERGVIGWLL